MLKLKKAKKMTTTETLQKPQKLSMENENGKFACKVFLQIHFAPPLKDIGQGVEQLLYGPMLDRIYSIEHEGSRILVKLIHYEIMPIVHIESAHTYACSGIPAIEWKKRFHEKYKETNHLTKVAIYCYERID